MPLIQANIEITRMLVSDERLQKLIAKTGSAEDAIALHQETLEMGGYFCT